MLPVPPELRDKLSPAEVCVYESTDYWLKCPGADGLRIGGVAVKQIEPGLFPVRFENQLGLTTLQPMFDSLPVGQPLYVEVISPKFPSAERHVAFFCTLLDDLAARAARLPFAFNAATARAVAESLQRPTPLFTYHFLCQYAPTIRTAVSIIQADPHRRLHDRPEHVSLHEATEVDADVLVGILSSPDDWVRSPKSTLLARRLGGFAPERVWQRLPEETLDTPENRFALTCLRAILTAADVIPTQAWWDRAPADRRRSVREISTMIRETLASPLFAPVGQLHHVPLASRVLLRREGYRDLLTIWQTFQHARRPLFKPLSQAMDVRDIALLYEIWVFFALVEEIAVILNEAPSISPNLSDETGLGRLSEARFSTLGRLLYNRPKRSYSHLHMRPDFTWLARSGDEVALDAKFRLDRPSIEPDADESTKISAQAKYDDLYRMHTYRDGLGIRAAVCIYPGDVSVFHHENNVSSSLTLRELLLENWSGIGAIAMSPATGRKGR